MIAVVAQDQNLRANLNWLTLTLSLEEENHCSFNLFLFPWARLTCCAYSCKITLTACNPALLHVASTAPRGAEGGSNLGRCSPASRSPISAPSQWEHQAHRLGPWLPAGWGEALPAWVNREAVNESGEGIICLSVLLPCLALRSHCREMEKMRRNPPPPLQSFFCLGENALRFWSMVTARGCTGYEQRWWGGVWVTIYS